jgi:hypothetical protein
MVEPLSEFVRTACAMPAETLLGDQATKARLQETLRGARPALFYSASHGMAAPDQDIAIQKRVHGAICCQKAGPTYGRDDWLFTAEDVPADEPFLEGAVYFQFACFGYGTPAESDFAHWVPNAPPLTVQEDFIAALPKRLLAHPRGPIGYVGHVDLAWLHGFDDPAHPRLLERWHPRIEPFVQAVTGLLKVQPLGLAMANMHGRYNVTNSILTGTYDRIQRGRVTLTPEYKARLASTFITRSDAQNYLIFGDPAAHLRIPDR